MSSRKRKNEKKLLNNHGASIMGLLTVGVLLRSMEEMATEAAKKRHVHAHD